MARSVRLLYRQAWGSTGQSHGIQKIKNSAFY